MQVTSLPTPESIKNFPANLGKVVIVRYGKILRVIKRNYYWDKEAKRGKEHREYIGYVVDGEFLSTAEYRDRYFQSGRKRVIRQSLLEKISQDETVSPEGNENPKENKASSNTKESSAKPPFKWSALSTALAAELPVYYEMARRIGLVEDLTKVWGEEAANLIISLASQWLHTSNNALYLYESWSPDKLLPFADSLSSKEICQNLRAIVDTPDWRRDFFKARIDRLPEDEVLSFDATEIGTEAQEISYAQYGKGKEGGYQKQLGLILLVGHHSGQPALFRMIPGQITDVTTVPDMLFRFDEVIMEKKRVFAAVLDRGYFSIDNLAKFIDSNSRVVMAAKTDSKWVREAMLKDQYMLWMHETRLKGTDCWGQTFACQPHFPDGKERTVYVHVFRSEEKSHIETQAFYEEIEKFERDWMSWRDSDGKGTASCPLLKSPLLKYFKPNDKPGLTPLETDADAINNATALFGFFSNVTTMPCATKDALEAYRSRDLIEKTFKSGKSEIDMDAVRAHTDRTCEGRFIVSFVALSILSRLRFEMRQMTKVVNSKGEEKTFEPLAKEMTFNELKNRLGSIRMVFDGKGRGHWMEVTTRQHEIARRLGCPGLYKSVPAWVPVR